MRTRDAKLTDYNVAKEDEERLDEYCKKTDSDLRFILLGCAISVAPGMELAIYESLVTGDGYYTLVRRGIDIPAKPDDFYGYRRKTKAEFYHRLKIYGLW